jgi:hypothetical protein
LFLRFWLLIKLAAHLVNSSLRIKLQYFSGEIKTFRDLVEEFDQTLNISLAIQFAFLRRFASSLFIIQMLSCDSFSRSQTPFGVYLAPERFHAQRE